MSYPVRMEGSVNMNIQVLQSLYQSLVTVARAPITIGIPSVTCSTDFSFPLQCPGTLFLFAFFHFYSVVCDYRKVHNNQLTVLVGRVFTNSPGDMGSILGRVIPKTLKMVLDTSLLNTQQYKLRIKGKVVQSRKRNSALPYTSV